MENNNTASVKNIAMNYGIYLGLLSITGLVILYLLNEESNIYLSIISIGVTIVIYYYGIYSYKKLNANQLRVRDGLKSGMSISAIGGLISAVYTYIHYVFVRPEFVANIKEKALEGIYNQTPKLEGEQLDLALKITDITTSPFFFSTVTIVGALLFGLIISLIIGAILKSN